MDQRDSLLAGVRPLGMFVISALLTPVALLAAPGDWPQWRGPDRTGAGAGGPALAKAWSNGLVKVWESEPIPCEGNGGFSTPSVTDGRVYQFVAWKYQDVLTTRKLPDGGLRQLGWSDMKMSNDLARVVEEARMSPERGALKGPELATWINKWMETHIPDEPQRKKIADVVKDRLNRGSNAIPLEVLAKLETIREKEFPGEVELKKWLDDNGIAEPVKKLVIGVIPTQGTKCRDVFLCIDASDGKTLWKKEYPGKPQTYGTSSTLCIADGRCYGVGSDGGVYCLNAKNGGEIWKGTKGGDNSSFLVVDGVAVVQGNPLVAFDAEKGTILWSQPKARGQTSSPVVWRKDGNTYLLSNCGEGISCVNIKTGDVLWKVPGADHSTPAVSGDYMAILTGNGMLGYKLATNTAEKVWNIKVADPGASVAIYNGYVYAYAGGRALCVKLDTGTVAWDQKTMAKISGYDFASPLVVDGKFFTMIDGGATLLMADAGVEKFTELGRANVGINKFVSPVIANGKLFARTSKAIVCYDLTK